MGLGIASTWRWECTGTLGAHGSIGGATLSIVSVQKKSREESSGEGSGVEILANRPYSDGPGGSGQYTHKIYHVGSHIPSWFRALLPKAALQVEEESWNAYPYTRTRWELGGGGVGCRTGHAPRLSPVPLQVHMSLRGEVFH